MMHIELASPYKSIKALHPMDVPDFCLIIGRNGVGKTQLLDAMRDGHISIAGISRRHIEKYDYESFRPTESEAAGWDSCIFAERTADHFFSGPKSESPVEMARNIYSETLESYRLASDSNAQADFRQQLLEVIANTPDFKIFPVVQQSPAIESYTQRIQQDVIMPLDAGRVTRRRDRDRGVIGYDGSGARLLCMTLKLSGKLPHEIGHAEITKAANYDGGTITNTLSSVFARYKVEQYSWAHRESESGGASVEELVSQYRNDRTPPWIALRESLERMRQAAGDGVLFNFEFSDPEEDVIKFTEHRQYRFSTTLTNRTTGDSYSITELSSGERILMSLCLAEFHQAIGRRRPKLMLLDEVDAVLHPSMVAALLECLRVQFVDRGTNVMVATHSITTAALAEGCGIYQMERSNDGVELRSVRQAEAVAELSEGIARLEVGLGLAMAGDAPVTILTEGANSLHLKRWAELFFPDTVDVFDSLQHRTGKGQLAAYAEFLASVNTRSHVVVVWDCDAAEKAAAVARALPEGCGVSAFAFERRTSAIATKGIENLYEDSILRPFATKTVELGSGAEIGRGFNGRKKREFAEHVREHGTREWFRHFSGLQGVVEDLLNRRVGHGGSVV